MKTGVKRSRFDDESSDDDEENPKSKFSSETRDTPSGICGTLISQHLQANGQLLVPKDALDKLKQEFGVPALAKGLSRTISTGGTQSAPLPYPFKRYFMGDATQMLRALSSFDWESRKAESPYTTIHGLLSRTSMFAPFTFDEGYLRIRSDPADYAAMDVVTDFFTEEPRLRSRRLGSKHCPFDLWINPALNVQWLEGLLSGGKPTYDHLSSESLRETMAYSTIARECTQFKPSLGVAVLRLLQGRRVLDFSSGWGDRLIAAIAAGVDRYVGVDPNPDLQPGYQQIIEQFAEGSTRFSMIQAPFQTAELPDEEPYDLVFTSPPYFNFELYSNPLHQSANEGTSLQGWLRGFLFPTLQKAWIMLKEGGHMALHIVDINPRVGAFTEVMNLYIQGWLPGAFYRGVVCSDGGESSRNRPIWIWRKQPPQTLSAQRQRMARRELQRAYPEIPLPDH